MGTFVSKCFLVVCRQAPTITSLAVGASHKRRQQYLTQGLATWGGVLRAECWWNCFAQLASIRKLCAPGEMAEKEQLGYMLDALADVMEEERIPPNLRHLP